MNGRACLEERLLVHRWGKQSHVRKLTGPQYGLAKEITTCVCSDTPTRMAKEEEKEKEKEEAD